jgi:hypothetical protein
MRDALAFIAKEVGMRRFMRTFAIMLGIIALAAPGVGAQVAWDSPFFVAPSAPAGWGVYLVDVAEGGGIGVLTTWRGSAAPGGFGLRLGLAEASDGELAVFGGVDVSGPFIQASDEIPVNIAWVAGAGLGIGENVLLSFPAGVSIGRDFEAENVWFNPWVSPRMMLDAWMGGSRPGRKRNLSLGLAVDLGMDVAFDPGWAIRFAGTLGDRSALGVGVSFQVF